jgi:hypothetical protein
MQTVDKPAMNTANTAAPTVILKILAEGGSLTLLGLKSDDAWRFRLVRNESTLGDLLNADDRAGLELHYASDWLPWADVLELLNEYPWHRLSPDLVHPAFRRQIWQAVQSKVRPVDRRPWWKRMFANFGDTARQARLRERQKLNPWRRACQV